MSQTEAWNIVNRTGFAPLEIRVCLKQSNVLYIDEDVLQLSRFECVSNFMSVMSLVLSVLHLSRFECVLNATLSCTYARIVLHLSRFECVLNLKWFRSTTRIPAQELVFTISCLLVVTRVNTSLRCKLENNNKVTVLSQGYRCIH